MTLNIKGQEITLNTFDIQKGIKGKDFKLYAVAKGDVAKTWKHYFKYIDGSGGFIIAEKYGQLIELKKYSK